MTTKDIIDTLEASTLGILIGVICGAILGAILLLFFKLMDKYY